MCVYHRPTSQAYIDNDEESILWEAGLPSETNPTILFHFVFFFFSAKINFMEVFNSFEIFWNYSKNIQLLNVRYDVKDEEGDDQSTTY